ncbi:MAG: bifunctional proline dehydrogenase/L-glutamate gamma-semialdehyde dehydrogenase PutA [Gammaproteobacteria bacterium]|nr:bifunctional proline dehydrogenase/L-glutamate gamma-semialdehyde dehydrogenase PutA [Gammaproteobacteria bacterium]
MIFDYKLPHRSELRAAISAAYRVDEAEAVKALLKETRLEKGLKQAIMDRARYLVEGVRSKPRRGGIEAFMLEYGLSTQEGTALMCLAESLLRVPDAKTEDELIEDKLAPAEWSHHLGRSESLFVNASTWAFMLTGKLLGAKESPAHDLRGALTRMLASSSEPLIREAVMQSMRIIGRQFIIGHSIGEGFDRAGPFINEGYRMSFDMLGEAARTALDADRFYRRYTRAITALAPQQRQPPPYGHEISVKLSALAPRYEFAQYERTMDSLLSRLKRLALEARRANIGLTIDAEESERLELQLDLFEALVSDPALGGWNGLGIAVQAYQKRTYYLLDWLADLARRSGSRLMVRLTKGAYWDAEIKRCQEAGLAGYPVFTRKASTDVSYIACTRKLLRYSDALYPMFATHNAYTAAMILLLSGDYRDYEFQRLHGMGEAMFEQIMQQDKNSPLCRIYAPCGGHQELLPYLVRRLLENGANTSFVNRILDRGIPVERIVADPIDKVDHYDPLPHPRIPLPGELYGSGRRNSIGLDLADEQQLIPLAREISRDANQGWRAAPLIDGQAMEGIPRAAFDPSDRRRQIGEVIFATEEQLDRAVTSACKSADVWSNTPVVKRAVCLERTAELFESHMPELMALCMREAGKTLGNAVAEIRETVDFCRYYAEQARFRLSTPEAPPAGLRKIAYTGHGVFACISPWNFPLAIFSGQIAAALVTGNTVVAKPAEQTSLIATRAIELFHQAGIPKNVLQFITGDGQMGARLVGDSRIAGVAFTGSTAASHAIRNSLADGRGEIVPLIAETGGQNVMIVDSTALPDQVIEDVIRSAFDSAGQRCSALRVLCLQEDIAEQTIELLAGAMKELRVGDPTLLKTDVGPVIDSRALDRLQSHDQYLSNEARLIHRCHLTPETEYGTFFSPCAYQIDSIDQLDQEQFGPFLHVLRYQAKELDKIIEAIHATGYGLTFGLHSRIDSVARRIRQRLRVGNIYVNRNMIGAVVGVQPFGGEGLSGTGPKAGGPHYLYGFAAQQKNPLDNAEDDQQIHGNSFSEKPNDRWTAAPLVGGETLAGRPVDITAYGDDKRIIGSVVPAKSEHTEQALSRAAAARLDWDLTPAQNRADWLETAADLLFKNSSTLKSVCYAETATPAQDTERDIRLAATLCRVYAQQAIEEFSEPKVLQGATGERNEYRLHNRGVVICYGADRQPVLSLTGMIAATLAAGNTVIVLPEQGSILTAARIFSYFLAAGFPNNGLHFLPLMASGLRNQLLEDQRLAAVAYLGDEQTAYALDAQLAKRQGPIIPLLATIKGQQDGGLFANPKNLYRFSTARTVSTNTTASGGNASLYAMDE